MSKRFYIDDFVEDLNYRNVILYVSEEIELECLREKLKKDVCNKLYRFENLLCDDDPQIDRFFYIDNCDFQTLSFPIHEYIDEGYNVYNLKFDDGRYFVEVDL